MRKWLESPWFWPVVAVIILMVLTRGQLLVAVAPMSKFLVPLVGGYLLYRFVKRRIQQTLSSNIKKTMSDIAEAQQRMQQQARYGSAERFQRGQTPEQDQPVIEICPTCGQPKKKACPDCK